MYFSRLTSPSSFLCALNRLFGLCFNRLCVLCFNQLDSGFEARKEVEIAKAKLSMDCKNLWRSQAIGI